MEDLRKVMPGQDVVYCAISGDSLPQISKNIVVAMSECGVKMKKLYLKESVSITRDATKKEMK